jgi:hypothetical protein
MNVCPCEEKAKSREIARNELLARANVMDSMQNSAVNAMKPRSGSSQWHNSDVILESLPVFGSLFLQGLPVIDEV